MAVTRWIVIERHGSHILRKIYRQPLQHHALPRNFLRHPVSSSPTSVPRTNYGALAQLILREVARPTKRALTTVPHVATSSTLRLIAVTVPLRPAPQVPRDQGASARRRPTPPHRHRARAQAATARPATGCARRVPSRPRTSGSRRPPRPGGPASTSGRCAAARGRRSLPYRECRMGAVLTC